MKFYFDYKYIYQRLMNASRALYKREKWAR